MLRLIKITLLPKFQFLHFGAAHYGYQEMKTCIMKIAEYDYKKSIMADSITLITKNRKKIRVSFSFGNR